MKKMPIVKRILAAAMVIAMVATSAHFDWNLFSLKGKAADWSSTSYTVTSGGEIRQVIQRSDNTGDALRKLDSLKIQVTVQPGQTVYASATVSQGAGVTKYSDSVNALVYTSASPQQEYTNTSATDAETKVFTFDAFEKDGSAADIYFAEGEAAIASFTLSESGGTGEGIAGVVSFSTTATEAGGIKAGIGTSIGLDYTFCVESWGAAGTDANAGVTSIALDKSSVVLSENGTATITPTLSPSLYRKMTVTSSDPSVVKVPDSGTTTGAFTVTAVGTGEATITVSCGTATAATVNVKVLTASLNKHEINYGEDAPDVTVSYGGTPLTKDAEYTVSTPDTNAGTATLTVTGKDAYAGFTWSDTYTINKVSIDTRNSDFVSGQYTIDVSENDVTGATVAGGALVLDRDFTVSQVTRGTATSTTIPYTITVAGKGNYNGTTTFTYNYNVSNAAEGSVDLEDIAVVKVPDCTYDGSVQKPTVGLYDVDNQSLKLDGMTLDVDYTVEYEDSPKNCGTYEVIVRGIGKYTGTITGEYVINQVSLADTAKVEIKDIGAQNYTGSKVEPALTITRVDTNPTLTLVKGTDYTVTYSSNINVGTATATITGIGNYKGTVTKDFVIKKDLSGAEITIESKYTAVGGGDTGYNKKTYDGNEVKPIVNSVVLGGTTLTENDYTVTYENNTNASNQAKVVITGKGTVYSGQSTFVYFTIKPKSISSSNVRINSVTPSSATYTGEKITPTAQVIQAKINGSWVNMTEGTDYTITYENNIDAGTAKAVIVGTGNYSGTVEKSAFEINPYTVKTDDIQVADQMYDGTAKTPEVTVKIGEKVISADNYTVSYSNNTEVGTAVVTVTGKNNLKGTATKNFTIGKKQFKGKVQFKLKYGSTDWVDYGIPTTNEVTISSVAKPLEVEYTGSPIYPEITVLDGDTTLVQNSDYIYRIHNVTNASTGGNYAQLIVVGSGNYENDAITLNFKINPKSIGDGKDAASGITTSFNKSTKKLTIKNGTRVLTEDEDYELSWEGKDSGVTWAQFNSTPGSREVTVTGKNNYKDSFKCTCTVGTDIAKDASVYLYCTYVGFDGYNSTTNLEYKGKKTSEVDALTTSAFTTAYLGDDARPLVVLRTKSGDTYTNIWDPTNKAITDTWVTYSGGKDYGSTVTVTVHAPANAAEYFGSFSFTYTVGAFDLQKVVDPQNLFKDITYQSAPSVSSEADKYIFTGNAIDAYKNLAFDTTNYASYLYYETDADKLTPLTKGTHYTIVSTTPTPMTNKGTYRVELKMSSANFTGGMKRSAEVTAGSVNDITIGKTANAPVDVKASYDGNSYTYPTAPAELEYTGSAVRPFEDGTWNLYFGGKVVNASTYDVTYYTEKDASIPFAPKESSKITATDEPKDAGTYYFKIALKDNFDNGTICGSFVIKRKPVTQNNVEIRIDKDTFIYDQQTHKAGTDFPVAVYYNGSNSAIDSSYYTVSVAPSELGDATCTYPGKYTISVTFTGADNFAQETVTRDYKIYGVLAEDSTLIEALDSADPEHDNKLVNSTYPITKEQGAFKSSFDASKIFLKYAGVECAYQDGKYFTVTTKNMLTPGVASITVKGNGEYFKGSKTYKVYSKGSLDDLAETDITGWMEQENSAGVKERVYPYTGDVVIPSGLTLYYNGKALKQGTDYSVSVEDTTGNEGAIGPHTVKFTGINSFAGSKSVQFYVRYDLSKAAIKLTNTSETYTGAEIKPVPTAVTYTNGGSTVPLDPTTDYDIEYENNTAVGTATIKITPKTGRSYSSKSKNFTITGIDVGGNSVTVDAIADQTYAGKDLTPAVNVTRGGKPLSKDTDYTVSYKNNKNVGIATVTIKGINNYSGTTTKTFEITPRSINDVEVTFASGTTPYEVPYNGGKNVVLTAGTDYTVTDSVGGSSKPLTYGENADYTVTYDAKSAVATSASDYGKFIITGHGNYTGTRTITDAFKVVAANIGEAYVTVEKDSTEYTGQNIKPAKYLTLSINGEEINKDENYYTVSIVGQTGDTVKDVGEYTVTITGNEPNYTGEKTITFKVTQRSLNDSENHTWDATKYTWTLDKTAWDYNNGNEVKPTITVAEDKDLGLSLANGKFKEGTDYTVSYANNTNSGSATDANGPVVKVTGMGNYTGEIWIHFSIGKDISTAAVTLAANEYTYDGKEHKPKVSSVTLNSATLRATRDYTVSYADDQDKADLTNAGTKKAVVTGTGAYYGTVTKTYTINKKNGTSANISVVPKDYAYDKTGGYYYIIYPGEAAVGGGLQPDLVVTDTEAKITLEEGVDYELVDVINNTNAGSADNKATITIRLKGNYATNTVEGSFVILPRSLSAQSTLATISLTKESCEWDDGNAIDPGVTVYDDLGNPLEKDKDYTLALSDNVNVGDATVTITGINNYKDTLTKKFVIYGDLDDAEISDIPEMFYTGEKIIPHPTIVCGGKTLVEGTDYTLDSYSDNNFKTSGKLRVTIPDDKKKYYLNGPLDIEFYIGDDTTSLVVTTDKAEYTYTGSAIKPSVKVTDAGGSELAYDADSITYVSEVDQEKCIAATTPDNKKVNVTVMVTTADGAQVPVTGSYKIAPLSLDDCNIGTITNDTYTGKAITPPVSVVIGDIAMTKDVDFEVVYENNVNPGTAKVTVTGINNCTGSKELNFAIAPAKMQNVEAYGYSDSGILLKWTAQNHVDGYLITYSVNGKEKTATTTNNSITLTGLSSSTAYEVGVCTYVTAGGQKYYGTATKVTGRTYPKTSAFLVTSPAKKQAQVSWSVQSGVGYEIYRSTSPSSGFKCIADVPSTKTSFTDTGVKSGKTYYYYIQAYQVVNGVIYNGQPSDVKAITIK